MGRAFEYRRAAKEKRWDKMSKVFPKLGKMITLAAKDGADPETNARLRAAIMAAKAQNMPKNNIEAAIARAGGGDDNLRQVIYEGKAAHGVLLIIECATNNDKRTIANLKSYFNRAENAMILQNGSLEFMFAHKAVFEILNDEILRVFGEKMSENLEKIELFLIDFGLMELTFDGDTLQIFGEYFDFKNLSDGLKNLNLTPQTARLEYIPTQPISLNAEQMTEIDELLCRIEDDDDVQNVFTNLN